MDLLKTCDFECHSKGGVNCAVFGSSRDLLATAGRDRSICLWAFNKIDKPLVTVNSNSYPESLAFSFGDNRILAYGSMSGSIKLWDCKTQQNLSTFSGHKANCRVLCSSPTNMQIWASSSLDSTIRVWDARQKRSAATYTNVHAKTVTALQFSPHGAWLATGSDDCTAKVLDIPAGGATRAEMVGHSDSVSDVRFHPYEYLLASGSQDKTVRFWDLESFECVSLIDSAGPVQKIRFYPNASSNSPENNCLFAASEKGLRLLGWEPARIYRHLSVAAENSIDWPRGGILDLAFRQDADTAACFCKTKDGKIAVFSVDIEKLRPFSPPVQTVEVQQADPTFEDGRISNIPDSSANTVSQGEPTPMLERAKKMRRSFHERYLPSPTPSGSGSTGSSPEHRENQRTITAPNKETPQLGMGDPNGILTNFADEEDVFKPRPKIRTSPPSTPSPVIASTPIVFESKEAFGLPAADPLGMTFTVNKVNHSDTAPPVKSGLVKKTSPLTGRKTLSTSRSFGTSAPASTSLKKPTKATATVAPQPVAKKNSAATASKPAPLRKITPTLAPSESVPDVQFFGKSNDGQFSDLGNTYLVDSIEDSKMFQDSGSDGIRPEDFLPDHFANLALSGGGNLQPRGQAFPTEESALSIVSAHSKAMSAVLQHRAKNLELIRRVWKDRGLRQVMDMGLLKSDPTGSLLVELLKILNSNNNYWSLDLCVLLLPEIKSLLTSANGKREPYVKVAGESLRQILQGFGEVIKNGMKNVPSIGPDVEGEARAEKCRKCASSLDAIRIAVGQKQKQSSGSSELNQAYRQLGILLQL